MSFAAGVQELVSRLLKVNPDDLERKGMDYTFSDVKPLIYEMFHYIEILKATPNFGEYLPEDEKERIYTCLSNFAHQVEIIQNFGAQTGDRDSIKSRVEGKIRTACQQSRVHLSIPLRLAAVEQAVAERQGVVHVEQMKGEFSAFKKQVQQADSRIQQTINSLDATVKEKTERLDATFKEKSEHLDAVVQKTIDKANDALKAAKEASALHGVGRHAGVFADQARQNKTAASIWLGVSILSAVVLVACLLALIFCFPMQSDNNLYAFLKEALPRVLLLSFLWAAFHHAVKNYNANMHLYTLNKHRRNNMVSFRAFVRATKDPKITDAVLMQATKAIFEAGETGYVSSKGGNVTDN